MSVNETIKNLRTERKLTQNDLAEMMNCNRQKIADLERGKSTPSANDLILLSKIFNVSADYLLGLSDTPTTDKDIQFICEYTGLSKKAVEVLSFYKGYEMIYPTINKLLESEMSSFLQELGYMCSDMPKDKLIEKCKENNIDFDELENIIETKDYECLQVVSTLEQYLNLKKPTSDKILSISQSGKIISLSETNLEYTNNLTFDDLISIKTIKQSELVESVIFENVIEKIKQLKQLNKDGESNVNNP